MPVHKDAKLNRSKCMLINPFLRGSTFIKTARFGNDYSRSPSSVSKDAAEFLSLWRSEANLPIASLSWPFESAEAIRGLGSKIYGVGLSKLNTLVLLQYIFDTHLNRVNFSCRLFTS